MSGGGPAGAQPYAALVLLVPLLSTALYYTRHYTDILITEQGAGSYSTNILSVQKTGKPTLDDRGELDCRALDYKCSHHGAIYYESAHHSAVYYKSAHHTVQFRAFLRV